MFAIVEIAGLQYKVREDQRLYVNRLAGEAGDKVNFDRVMLTDDDGQVTVGAPVIDGASVEATIVEHLKADKVLVFKKKRRKGYQKMNGHRQPLTYIQISNLGPAKKAPKAKAKTEEAPAEKAVETQES